VKKFLWFVLIGLTLWVPGATHADLQTKFRAAFPELIQTGFRPYFEGQALLERIPSMQKDMENKASFEGPLACYSTIEYGLDRSFEETHQEYHQKMTHLFGDSFETTRFETEKLIGQDSGPDGTPKGFIPGDTKYEWKGKALLSTQRDQERLGFVSVCSEQDDQPKQFLSDSIPTDPYSACRVTETVLNEWCGYRLYLWGKLRDKTLIKDYEASVVTEGESPFELESHEAQTAPIIQSVKTPQYAQSVSQFRTLQIEHEYTKAHQALLQMLEVYRLYEHQHRKHVWNQHIKKSLLSISSKMYSFRKAYYKFPEKFINASAKRCR